jgi:hypothetical protein
MFLWPAFFFMFFRRVNRSSASVALRNGVGLLVMVGIALTLVGVLPLPAILLDHKARDSDNAWLLPLTVAALGATLLFIAWRLSPAKSKIADLPPTPFKP